jgi:hypothetical protein
VNQIIQSAPKDWDIIQLCYINKDLSKVPQEEFTDRQYSAAAYIISKEAAVRLINQTYSNGKYYLENSIQHVADVYIYEILKTYTYRYPMFIYKMKNTSTIHETHLDYHVLSRKLIEKHIYKMVDDLDRSMPYNRYWWVYILVAIVIVLVVSISFRRWFYKAIQHFLPQIKLGIK